MSPPEAKPRTAKTAISSIDEIASVRIELVGSEPLIWREVEVPTSITLKGLHNVVQAAMGWFDYHLWQFTLGKRRLGPSGDVDVWDPNPPTNAAKVRLHQVLAPGKTVIEYL